MASKAEQLQAHHARMVAWRAEGLSLRQIASRFQIEGLKVDFNAVNRYCKKAGIPTDSIVPKSVKPSAPVAPVAPAVPADKMIAAEKASAPVAVAAVPESTTEPDIPEPPEPAPEPWEPPTRLYTPLAYGPWWTSDLSLVRFGGGGEDDANWTLQDACEGTFITGATGSGKTSGSGATLARSFLEHGFGGLVLTVKPDERRLWEHYAKQCGRSSQLCIVEPNGRHRINFLDYEARRPTPGSVSGMTTGVIENLVTLFYTILEVYTRSQGDQAAKDFWENAGRQLLRNVLRVLEKSRVRLSLEELGIFLSEAPQDPAQVSSGQWKATKHFGPWLERATARAKGTPYERVIAEACRYWLAEFPALASETRSCLVTGLTAMADSFVEPAIHDLFCTDTTNIPEATQEGAIILVDLPLKRYKTVGLFAQMIWKHLFQEAIERRWDSDDATRRPVFLWADEAQFFYSAYDGLFQSTARSSRCATVYLTQNIPNFYGTLGGHQARSKVDGFLGNLNTKIFHCNNDPTTNTWAAEQIGKSLTHRFSGSSGSSRKNFWDIFPAENHSSGMQEVIDYEVQPGEFTQLRTGSEQNDRLVDAYFVKSGARFGGTGKHYFKTIFQQEPRA